MQTKLRASVVDFLLARMRKLEKKARQGYVGWDDKYYELEWKSRVRMLAKKKLTQKNLVNIANYCNFLWQMLEDRKVK